MKRMALSLVVILSGAATAAADVACKGVSGGHMGAAPTCDRLMTLLSGRDLAVTLELTRDEPKLLAGRLVWQAGGQSRSGPVVEVTARDTPLDARAADRLARGLLAVSDLP